jgi:putative ABC transport system ATP-binding protein
VTALERKYIPAYFLSIIPAIFKIADLNVMQDIMVKNKFSSGREYIRMTNEKTDKQSLYSTSLQTETKPAGIYDQATQPHVPTASMGVVDANPNARPVIRVRNIKKTYLLGQSPVYALHDVSLDVYPGEFVAIMGPSGSGKSTFMNLLGCLDRPTRGEYWLAGNLVSRMSNEALARVRNRLIGFVFQSFNLLSKDTALSNVELPMVYAGVSRETRQRRARQALHLVGLGSRMDHKPMQLSGGQQQRVAIARSLVNSPSLLLADEPTGNLDSRTSVEILALLQELNRQGLTIVLVTHESDIASYTSRQVVFHDGRVMRDEPNLTPRSAEAEWQRLLAENPTND